MNSTFYGQPRAEVARGWAERTPARLRILGQALSEVHASADVQGAGRRPLPADARDDSALIDAAGSEPNAADIDEFRRGIDPLASSGRLGALLAQFPASFKDTPASRDYLAALLRAFAGY